MNYVTSHIYMEGIDEMVTALKEMGAENELQKLNLEVGKLVVKEARELVPVRNGDLRDSIRASKATRVVLVQAGRDPLIPYANPINWGWFYDRKWFIKKNIKPTQFMNKAAKKVRKEVATVYSQGLIAIYEKYSGQKYAWDRNIVENTRGFED